jgi:hypothetical protein
MKRSALWKRVLLHERKRVSADYSDNTRATCDGVSLRRASNQDGVRRVQETMHVFTPTYLHRLGARWSARAEQDWPLIARIALHDYRKDDRDRIEAYVSRLHIADQPKMVRNLQSEKQFITAYGELLIGELLANAGMTPRYEPELRTAAGIYTPDWYLDGCDPIVLDVFTAGLKQQRDADETSLREIESRFAAVRAGYMISLEVENAASLDSRGRKDLVRRAAEWLSLPRRKGDTVRIGAAMLEVLFVGGTRLDVITTESIHTITAPAMLAENFEEKAKRYAPLGFPVIAGAVKHHRAEIKATIVEDVLFGQLAYVSRETVTGRIVGQTERLPDGVFARRPELSAAIWMEPYRLPEPLIRVWCNPLATRQVPPALVTRLTAATL